MSYKGFGYMVDSCPINQEETTESASRLNCGVDENGRNQYVCVPNQDLTSIVEFCYTKSIVGLYEDGHCLRTVNDGFLDQISCKSFTEGCPTEVFRSTDLFKYPACHRLNTEDRCFVADPLCNASTVLGVLNTTTDNTSYSNATTTAVDEGSINVGAIVGVVSLLILAWILIVAFVFWRRRNGLKRNRRNLGDKKDEDLQLNERGNETESLLYEPSEPEAVSQKRHDKTGDYNVWKTLISDQFSTLTNEEVSVLYCFLCSDSGPPDFTDTEWLDMLNEIRRRVYREDPVTSEEAQQTLNRLKSHDFLWVDQTREHLTGDAQDEIMYRVSNRVDDINVVFYFSSFVTAQRYLRSVGYKRKPGEKCVSSYSDYSSYSVYSDSLLVRRLQMDILTHVTMEDWGIFDNVSRILNIPLNIVKGSENERQDFQDKFKETGENVHYRRKSEDSVQHVKWLWRYQEDARPDIVRSCIGLHPHNDIYIIDNKAYSKPNQYHTYPPDIKCLLYCLLLVNEYTLDVNERSHETLLKELKERYFTDLTSSNEPDVKGAPEGITDKQGSSIKFKSDKIRHDVMYAFITECLVEESDLKFFMTTASGHVVSEYCRSWNYERSEEERCLYIPDKPDEMCDLFIDNLQMDILVHSFVSEKIYLSHISKRLNTPVKILQGIEKERIQFREELKRTGERVHYRGRSQDSVEHLKWLWRYGKDTRLDIMKSCVGLHLHWDIYIIDNKACRKPIKYHDYPSDVKCFLYCILLVDEYTLDVNEESHETLLIKLREKYFTDITDLPSKDEINLISFPEGVVDKQGSKLKFESDEIRHDVMYAFVTECLVEDSDLNFFLRTASRCVVSEYCRSWEYEKREGERCLYIPDKPDEMYDLFIDNLQEDILTHSFVSEKKYHKRISKRLNIPEEIFSWDRNALERFVKISRQGRVEMFRARGMIVGCAGAGKTTLLRKLQRKRNNENESTKTTVGLEVHEDLFEIEDDTLKDFSSEKDEMLIRGFQYHSSHNKKLISMTDFAGQVAYYACHQVYLSRRAFYIIVIDMSKGLNEKVHNTDRHSPKGTLFHAWKYKDYFHFWLQSIKTYCDEGNTQETDSDVTAKGISHPVILIASHKDKQGYWRKKTPFYTQLEKCLSEKQTLKELISLRRYFEVECPPRTPTNEQEEKLDKVRKCIVETVKQLPQWGEQIPLKWAKLEEVLRLKKQQGGKVLDRHQLKNDKNIDLSNDEDLDDSLRFFHEIGQIIYFSEEKMKNVIIINVQWFVDAFKYIITDETHLAREDCNDTLIKTGRITGKVMEEIWRNTKEDGGSGESYIRHKDEILPYLDKLGIMTKVQIRDKDTNDEMYYIPSMNRNDLSKDYENAIRRGQKTSILVFHFKTYLPHFFFFRLVANCLNKWTALDLEMFCKNAAFYKVEDASHYIAIAVNKTSIQLQVFTPDEGMDLQTECVVKIRETVEILINEITETFHRKTKYEKGYTCTDINITEEDEKFFLTEKEVVALKASSGKRPCPKHVVGKEIHIIDKNKILRFWWKEDVSSSSSNN